MMYVATFDNALVDGIFQQCGFLCVETKVGDRVQIIDVQQSGQVKFYFDIVDHIDEHGRIYCESDRDEHGSHYKMYSREDVLSIHARIGYFPEYNGMKLTDESASALKRMPNVWSTFDGQKLKPTEICQQHLSNIYWYMVVIMKFGRDEFSWVMLELKRRFNGQMLPYRPHTEFKEEIQTLADNGMLESINVHLLDRYPEFPQKRRIIIHGHEVGEIIEKPITN